MYLSHQCKCVEMFSQFFIMRIDYVDMIQSYFLISILNSILCKVDIAVDIVKERFEKKRRRWPCHFKSSIKCAETIINYCKWDGVYGSVYLYIHVHVPVII